MRFSEEKFNTLYQTLNPAQKDAVDLIEGPVMVVAGPGTGKTQILAVRIANILSKTDTAPESVLALTFTESGVVSMRRRLAEIMGSVAYRISIYTFHGFCNDIIKKYPESFPRIISSRNITEIDQIKILEELISKLPLKLLRPFGNPLHYIRAVLSDLNELKREAVQEEKFYLLIEDEEKAFYQQEDLYYTSGAHKGKMKGVHTDELLRIQKQKELALVYKAYQQVLGERKLYDYSDMIMEVVRALRSNEDLLRTLQEEFQYILVDEHQDTNNAQNNVLELLGNFHANPNLFVVGDEKQAIFRFQGASLENFLHFKSLYPDAKLIVLEENYRSTQPILDSAHSLLAGPKPLKSHLKKSGPLVELFSFSSPEVENYFLAQHIGERIQNGVSPSDIAVLYRENKDAFDIARALAKQGIPFLIQSQQNLLDDTDIQKLLILLSAVSAFGDQESFVSALHIDFLEVDPLDVYKLIAYSSRQRVSVVDVARSKENMVRAGINDPERIKAIVTLLSSWATLDHNIRFIDFLEILMRESGLLAHILKQSDSLEKMDKLNDFFDEIKKVIEVHKDFKSKDIIEYVHTLNEHNIFIKRTATQYRVARAHLLTAHLSKGMEFEYVYITRAFDGHWGNKRSPNLLPLPNSIYATSQEANLTTDKNDDERRLFYVALTRAKKGVIISYSLTNAEGRDQLPTQFIQEINQHLIKSGEVAFYENKFLTQKETLFSPITITTARVEDKDFVKELFLQNGFSVTALNNYLECPWKYFYTNLLRLPQAPTKHQLYGTALHGALKDFFDAWREGRESKELLLSQFQYHMQSQPLSEMEIQESLEKGKKSLAGYFETYRETWPRNLINEFSITGILLAPDIRLTGKIDKIEILDASEMVNVVDYKTGKPKTRGVIDGTTKNSQGDIRRQLVFYKMLLEHYDGGRYKMISADIDFIEPDDKNRYHKERFIIESEEVKQLEQQIKEVAHQILELSFWNTLPHDKDCEFCSLRKMSQK